MSTKPVQACLIVLIATILAAATPAQDCIEYGVHARRLGSGDWGGRVYTMAAADGLVYLGSASHDGLPNRLLAVDPAGGENPVLLGEVELPQMPVDMVIRGTTAFVACASGGGCLALVDIADPADPRVVSTLSPYGAHSVELYGDYALFTTVAPTFIADVSDPAAPELVSWVATGGAVLAVAGVMFVGDGDHNLRYYDIVDPAEPVLLGSLTMPDAVWDLKLVGDQLYVACDDDGVVIVDVGDPRAPVAGLTLALPGSAREFEVLGDQVFVVLDRADVVILDASLPSSPQILDPVTSLPGAYDVAVEPGHAYLTDGWYDLVIYAYPEAGTVQTLGTLLEPERRLADMAVVGSLAVTVAESNGGLQVVDIADPTQPVLLGEVTGTFGGSAVVANATHAFVRSAYYLDVVDISTPTDPVRVTRFDLVSNHKEMALDGDLIYLNGGTEGIYVIDVADPADLRLINTIQCGGEGQAIEALGSMLYVAYGTRLEIRACSDPLAPILVSTVELPHAAENLSLDEGVLYAACGAGGLVMVDVFPPTTPEVLGSLAIPGYTNLVRAAGGHAYVQHASLGFVVVDVHDPGAPVLLGNVDLLLPVMAIGVTEQAVCLGLGPNLSADPYYVSGVALLPLECATTTSAPAESLPEMSSCALSVHPNPFNPQTVISFDLARTGFLRLTVHDPAGRRLAVLTEGEFTAGRHALVWDGRDGEGRGLPSGTYLLRSEGSGGYAGAKLTLIR